MQAFIVLQGLFLLNCDIPQQPPVCDLLIADVSTHEHLVFGTIRLPSGGDKTMMITTLTNSVPNLFTPAVAQKFYVLDKHKIGAQSDAALYRIRIPRPDHLWGSSRIVVDRKEMLNNTPDVLLTPNLVCDRIAEVVVLAYDTGQPFELKGANGYSVPSIMLGGKPTLVLSSRPPVCTDNSNKDHAHPFNLLLNLKSSPGPVQFKWSGVQKASKDDDDTELRFTGLPRTVLDPRCVRPVLTAPVCPSAAPASGAQRSGGRVGSKGTIFTITPDGCGLAAIPN